MDDLRADPVVLLVDDDEIERYLLRQALEPAGFEIIEAQDGAAALEAFAATLPDIVVLDVVMPEIDGFAVCETIRAMPAGRNTPILMATGLDDVGSIERAYRVGATDFISKPISCPVLPYRLRYMLRAYRLAEAQRIAGLGHFRWTPRNSRIECSPTLSRMFGLSGHMTEHSARSLFRQVHPADRAGLIRAVRDALHDGTIALDHRIVTPAGEVRTLGLRGEVQGAAGAGKCLQGSCQDITERSRVERELKAARDEAETASAAKTAFLAGMSHELYTPLNAIIGFSDLILQQELGPIAQPEYVQYARNIRSAGQRALDLFLDVITMAELEAERFQLRLEKVDLGRVVRAAVEAFGRSEPGVHRQIDLVIDEGVPAVDADPRAVTQMLFKLLSNAAKFSATETAIRVGVGNAGNGSPRLSVVDTGIGMTAQQAELAVRSFSQVEGELARRYPGLGLGLSIVNGLIERHGGRLTITSAPQQGTQVSLDFPPSGLGRAKSLTLNDKPFANRSGARSGRFFDGSPASQGVHSGLGGATHP